MKRFLTILIAFAVSLLCSQLAEAQFKQEAFSQNYNTGEKADTAQAPLFSIKQYARGIAHKDTLKIGTLFAGSTVLIGGQQIYHKQYWKLPIIYGSIGTTVGLGFHYRNKYNQSLDAYNAAIAVDPSTSLTVDQNSKTVSTLLFVGGALAYWGTLMDGVVSYKGTYPQPGKATLYAILLPGMGQMYNQEYWKIPIYWGVIGGATHFFAKYKRNYTKYRDIYIDASTNPDYSGPISAETALYYRDLYRRYRDYSVLAIAAAYLLQVIDANVFSYMHDFEVSNDISLQVRPTVISPDVQYAISPTNAYGISIGFTF